MKPGANARCDFVLGREASGRRPADEAGNHETPLILVVRAWLLPLQ